MPLQKKTPSPSSYLSSQCSWYIIIIITITSFYAMTKNTFVYFTMFSAFYCFSFVYRILFPEEIVIMMSRKEYEVAVNDAKRQMIESINGKKVSLSQKGNVSTIFSQSSFRSTKTLKLDISKFIGIIELDDVNQTVTVCGKTPFKMLTEYLLPLGYCVMVVPELDTITVGGAISGVGIESSSFRYGFVHNTMIEFDVLLGDGRVITASEQMNRDLFLGFAHSYGTFGYLLNGEGKLSLLFFLSTRPLTDFAILLTHQINASQLHPFR